MAQFQMQTAEALKKLLKAKGIVYQDLVDRTGLSLPSIKRILSKGEMTLGRLEEICHAADIAVSDVLKLITTLSEGQPEELTEEQEKYLARYPHRFAHFDLLLTGMKPKQIESEFKLTQAQTHKILNDLDKWGLIAWQGQYKIKLLTSQNIRLSKNGPLRSLFSEECMKSFLALGADHAHSFQEFRTLRMSENSLRRLNQKLIELLIEIGKESELETHAQVPTVSVGTFFSVKKWRLTDAFGL